MLLLQTLRTQKDFVIDRLKIKNFKDLSLVDKILDIDEKRRKVQTQYEELLAKINAASKEIGKLMASGQKEDAERIKQEVLQYKESTQRLTKELEELEKQQYESLVLLPNLFLSSVPK